MSVAPLLSYEALGQAGRVRLVLTPVGRGVVLALHGSWHEALPPADADKVLAAIAAARPAGLGVDLSACPHLASVALGFLVLSWQEAHAAGARTGVVCAQPKVEAMLKILGLNQFLRAVRTPADLAIALA